MATRSAVVDDGVVSSFGVVSCVHEQWGGVLGGRFSGETFMILLLCSAFVKGEKKNERRED